MKDRLGRQLGSYRLTRLLGLGSFAEVYLGEHTLLGTTVAIKVLHTQVTPDDVAQFQQEALLLASLRHPNIIRILDFGLDEQTPYLVMDHAPNGNMRTRHPRGTRLPASTVVDYVKQLALALQYAHDRKVIHRDVKPENILIGDNDQILLSDFGIALVTQTSHYQSTKDMAGTITYMAPEQIASHPRPQSDLYSLGVVAYEWLCGTRPFQGTYAEMAIKHSFTDPPSPLKYVPTLLPDVAEVVLIALRKQPETRFASVTAFAHALDQASQDIQPSTPWPSLGLSRSLPPITYPIASLPTVVTGPANASDLISTQIPPGSLEPERMTEKPVPKRRAISRRALLIGVGGALVVGAVGIGVIAYLRNQSSGPTAVFTYSGHDRAVFSVAWSPDGKLIATGAFNKSPRLWSAGDGNTMIIYRGHFADPVKALAWSPDGKLIASGSDDRTVQVWSASDGSTVFTYKGHADGVNAVTWSPDGGRVASASSDKTVQVWNAHDGSNVFTYKGHADGVNAVAWSRDGKRIASGSDDKTVQIWNANDGSDAFTYKGHADLVGSVTWSPDGKRVASSSDDSTVHVWDASDGGNVFKYQRHTKAVNAVEWWPQNEKWIASCSDDHTVRVWNVHDGDTPFTYTGDSTVNAIAWSRDGKRIAVCYEDSKVQILTYSPS